jgi:hypothetical protein
LKTHKYFRGSIYIPLADVKAEGKKADTKVREARFRKLGVNCVDCAGYREMLRRKRSSRIQIQKTGLEKYLSRIESHRKESMIITKYVQSEWIAIDYDK